MAAIDTVMVTENMDMAIMANMANMVNTADMGNMKMPEKPHKNNGEIFG